ncbi:hypothetical protein KY285_016268 [Solanum tuberosum]|nr:hypothetical protein KY284_016259 [Solanum tuberosum]KAH0701990.1 hypothetical protein KY285_016268 [Solanum tuberosum]
MIPSRVRELQNLQYIDLSNNSYLQLDKLEILEFVFKSSPEGVILSGGVFANSTLQSFLQNKGICKMHILDMPACAIATPGQQSKLKEKKGKCKDAEKVPEMTRQLVSYHKIQQATNSFDRSNLIGEGGSDSMYKDTLSSGTLVDKKRRVPLEP